MKAEVIPSFGINLYPQSEAEKAILSILARHGCWVGGSTYESGGTTCVTILPQGGWVSREDLNKLLAEKKVEKGE